MGTEPENQRVSGHVKGFDAHNVQPIHLLTPYYCRALASEANQDFGSLRGA